MRYPILILLVFSCIFPQEATVGMLYHDSTKAFQGYTLFAPNVATTTYLIDMNGKLVHQWESEYVPKLSAYLLEDGDLLRPASIMFPPNNPMGGFQLFNWNNELKWEYYNGDQHHDIEYIDSNGNVLLIIKDNITKEDAVQAGRNPNQILGNYIQSLSIYEVKQTGLRSGEIVWRWDARDHLIQDYDYTKPNFGVIAEHPELININYNTDDGSDWLHPNSIAYNEELDQILISNRNINEVWIIDHSTTTEQAKTHEGGNSGRGGDLLYRWGNPVAYDQGATNDQQLHGQHDAHWINGELEGTGNILVFNNGFPLRNYSSVDEIVLPDQDLSGNYNKIEGAPYEPDSLIWQYIADPPERVLSPRYGGAQRLPNGNTLICNSESGEFLEVTPEKEIVWNYINPVTATGPLEQGTTDIGKNQVFRCYRYAPDYPAFSGKDLTAGNPIELYPTVKVEDDNTIFNHFKLYSNYPNPFNPSTNIEFSLTEGSAVNLIIYDMLGNEVCTLLKGYMEPGMENITWDAHDNKGNLVSGGIYLYCLKVGQFTQTKKMLLLK